jgi:hypothetical protein
MTATTLTQGDRVKSERPSSRLLLLWPLVGLSLLLGVNGSLHAAEPSNRASDVPSHPIIPPPLENLERDYKVRLIYFVPTDREVKPGYQKKTEVLMRVVADIYRREMKANGQSTRGLDFEFDEEGRLKVHLVKGKNPTVFYTGEPFSEDRMFESHMNEITEAIPHRASLIFSEAGGIAEALPQPDIFGGFAIVSGDLFRDEITASTVEGHIDPVRKVEGTETEPRSQASQVSNGVLIHELGHIFGMLHDSSKPENIMFYGYHKLGQMFAPNIAKERPVRFAPGHARIAAATRFLSEQFDESDSRPPVIHEFKLLRPPQAGKKTVEASLKISDSQGLGALVCMQRGGEWIDAMVADRDLEGVKTFEQTVTLKCPKPLGSSQGVRYILNVADVNGNLSQAMVDSHVVPK